MPNVLRTCINLTYELKGSLDSSCDSIADNFDVRVIKEKKGVKILRSDSALGVASSGEGVEKWLQYKCQCLEFQISKIDGRVWSYQELEIVKVWSAYKDQKHDLFLPSNAQSAAAGVAGLIENSSSRLTYSLPAPPPQPSQARLHTNPDTKGKEDQLP
ncbi:hypothetical protein IFM89_024596 [Coptis chinensis]|uniref:Uncharacterized protein n=1 Tax=Coptis chinensis TaxID=261450 RepID=A0A835M6G7_9MAGN|nr:hypothetical protein IFM89_024596 [Coptis chinensis]